MSGHSRRPGDVDFSAVHYAVKALSPEDVEAGEQWWADARRISDALAEVADVDHDRMAAVIAAMSPGISWQACVANVIRLVQTKVAGGDLVLGPGCGYQLLGTRGINRAWAILNGAPLSEARGPKVSAFAANLRGDMRPVTVDRHMIRLATGERLDRAGPAQVERIALAIRLSATIMDIPPATAAAALWIKRAKHGGVHHG